MTRTDHLDCRRAIERMHGASSRFWFGLVTIHEIPALVRDGWEPTDEYRDTVERVMRGDLPDTLYLRMTPLVCWRKGGTLYSDVPEDAYPPLPPRWWVRLWRWINGLR